MLLAVMILCQPRSHYNPPVESGLYHGYCQGMCVCVCVCVCVCIHSCTCVCVWFPQLDLLDLGVSPAGRSAVRVGLTQFLCVKLAMLWTDLAVEVSLCRVVVITQLDRIRHRLTWQWHAVKTNSGLDSRPGKGISHNRSVFMRWCI